MSKQYDYQADALLARQYGHPARRACSKCLIVYDLDERNFQRDRRVWPWAKGFYAAHCRACAAQIARAWIEENRDRFNETRRKWRARRKAKAARAARDLRNPNISWAGPEVIEAIRQKAEAKAKLKFAKARIRKFMPKAPQPRGAFGRAYAGMPISRAPAVPGTPKASANSYPDDDQPFDADALLAAVRERHLKQ